MTTFSVQVPGGGVEPFVDIDPTITVGKFKAVVGARVGMKSFRLFVKNPAEGSVLLKRSDDGTLLNEVGSVDFLLKKQSQPWEPAKQAQRRLDRGITQVATSLEAGFKEVGGKVVAVDRKASEILKGQAKAQADLTAIRAALESMQPTKNPGESELMEQLLNNMKVADMDSLIDRRGIALPPKMNKNGKARLLAQKVPLVELQKVLRDSATSGSAEVDQPASASVRDDRKRIRLLVHAKAVNWTPPTSTAHRQLQRQLAWKARCDEVDGQCGDQ